ncbi:MAG: alpha/beta hydrolase [Candidatus Omnitrophica bacterium]|nr:alpha/beta hydrolase [Candidatus Omnitrophota bacterium]
MVIRPNSFLLLIFVFILLIIYFRWLEKRAIFYPDAKLEFFPKDVGLNFKDCFFKTEDGLRLHGWFIPSDGANYTILFCHGNAGNISHRLEKILFFHQLGCNVFIFDYRGYGQSEGSPSEKGLYLDAESAYNHLAFTGITGSWVIGYGESIGSAVIIDLASRYKMAALILEGGFSCARDMARHIYPFVPYWVFSVRFDSINKIKSINIPKLIIHSLDDEIVPYKLSQRLYQAAPTPKEFFTIRGSHNLCFFESETLLRQKVQDFLASLSK